MWLFGRRTVLFWGPKNILKEITLFLKNDAQMDPNWVPKPNKINKNSNEICGKVQRIVSNTNAYNRISVVWGGGDDTPHGVFDYMAYFSCSEASYRWTSSSMRDMYK